LKKYQYASRVKNFKLRACVVSMFIIFSDRLVTITLLPLGTLLSKAECNLLHAP
ncbi:hypothetical protein BAE44_0014550, partial [Dichanthelium oligosanthes]